MSKKWTTIRVKMEEEGILFPEKEAAKIPRIARQNEAYWNHLRRLIRLIEKKDDSFTKEVELTSREILQRLFILSKIKSPVIYELEEFLALLYERDRTEGEFDNSSTSSYLKHIKTTLAQAKKKYAWRVGSSQEELSPSFLIGKPSIIPRTPSED